MPEFFPGFVIGFREGLEAFLIIAIIIRYFKKTNRENSIKYVWRGVFLGVGLSLLLGGGLFLISNRLDAVDSVAKLWESGASLFALALVTTFIIWMIKHGSTMTKDIENKLTVTISSASIMILSFVLIAREGVEIAIFTFAGDYSLLSILIGLSIALVLVVLVFYSLVKVNLNLIFNITLVYLILQAGFLLGYSIHEGLSAFNSLGYIDSGSILYTKLFDLSSTVLNHKTGWLGIPLYVGLGWYSKPEIIQFVIQYTYTISLMVFWIKCLKKQVR